MDRDFAVFVSVLIIIFAAGVVGSIAWVYVSEPPEVTAYTASVEGDGSIKCVYVPEDEGDIPGYAEGGEVPMAFDVDGDNVSRVNVFEQSGEYVAASRLVAVGSGLTMGFYITEGEYRLVAVGDGDEIVGESSLTVSTETVPIDEVDSVERGGDCG